jgi:hypothetical protein
MEHDDFGGATNIVSEQVSFCFLPLADLDHQTANFGAIYKYGTLPGYQGVP